VNTEVLMFSDLHIRGSKHRQVLIDSFNWVCEMIIEHSPRLVVMLGDTFHAYTSIEIPDLALAFDAYGDFASACEIVGAELIVLVGNHDQYSQDGEVHSMGFFNLVASKHNAVVNREEIVRQVGSTSVAFLGYVPSAPAWIFPDADVLFTHCPISGIDATFKDSHDWPKEAFSGFRKVFMGHYHDPSPDGKFVVVGSLTAQSFGDAPDLDRGIVLWDGKDQIKRVSNPHSPFYVTVDISSIDPGVSFDGVLSNPPFVGSYFDPDAHPNPGTTRTHVRVKCREDQIGHILEDLGDRYASVQIIPHAEEQVIERSAISVEMPVEQAVVEYAEQACPEGLDSEKLGAAGVAFVRGKE